jgi:MoxR-like ATPase
MTPPASRRAADPRDAFVALRAEVGKAVVGQDAAVTGIVVALLCRGHVLLEGVPGVAKTLLIRAVAAALSLETKRVQFTPDLMPGDVTGSLVYDARTSKFTFRPGPVFTNLLLAD